MRITIKSLPADRQGRVAFIRTNTTGRVQERTILPVMEAMCLGNLWKQYCEYKKTAIDLRNELV